MLTDRLQNELVKLARLTCISYAAVILKDLTNVSNKGMVQVNKIARNSTEEFQGHPSVGDVSIKEEGRAEYTRMETLLSNCVRNRAFASACYITQQKHFGRLSFVCGAYPPPNIVEELYSGVLQAHKLRVPRSALSVWQDV